MCLTLANASRVLDHEASPTCLTGFTHTLHAARYIEPGDVWIPTDDGAAGRVVLHTVTELHRQGGDLVLLVDQFGDRYSYRLAELIRTAVRDHLPCKAHLPAAATAATAATAPHHRSGNG